MRIPTLSLGRSLSLSLSLGCLILSSTCLAQTTNWVQVKPKNSPPVRWTHSTAHDSVRGRTIVFGGQNISSVRLNDTWEYDGKDWVQIKPKNSPAIRFYHAMVYHAARLTTVMFGGWGNSGNLNDTWLWDGKDWAQAKPKNSPPSRRIPAMAYDSARQRTVLFGGWAGGSAHFADTWEWDGSNWTQVKTKNAPSPRYSNMVYDSARKRIVLFGGFGGGAIQDTWEYDGKDWTKMSPTTQPSARVGGLIAYDIARRRTVLFSGWSGYWQDTWEYDGKNWTKMNPATQPAGRYDFDQMVYDPKRQRMVIFGGLGLGRAKLGDTWEYVVSPPLTGIPQTISIATGGTQAFSLDAGTANASRLYWIFGSVTGTSPGVTLASATGSVNIPLNPDIYTDLTIALANTPLFTKTRGTLDKAGKGSASFNVPKITNQSAIGTKLYHAYLVYDANNNFYLASNAVMLILVR